MSNLTRLPACRFGFLLCGIRVIRSRVRFLVFLTLATHAFGAGLAPYAQFVVSGPGSAPGNGVRVTYLGTNGYAFQFKGHTLLVDPYFSRVDLLSVALGLPIQPSVSRINDGLRHFACGHCRPDAILVTHGHFDHLLDVPFIMAKTGARLIASASSVELAKHAGSSSGDAVKPGDERRIGPWKIHVLAATHDRLFGKVPFDQSRSRAGSPQRAADWICGEPLAFLVEVNGQRIYVDSGGTLTQLPPDESVDLAILGVALPDSRERLHATLQRLHPRYILPSHQDNFFRPLSAGFQFGPLSDFPRVQRECKQENRGRLILLDYFRPWTLPKAQNPKFQQPNPKQNVKSQLGNGRQSQTSRSLRANISICTINPRVREAIAKNDWQRRRYSAVGPRVRLGCGQLDRSR